MVCPQKAKVVINHVNDVKQLLSEKVVPVIASVAPSFPAMLPLADPAVFPALLRRLGFSYIGQCAVGAELICAEHMRVTPPGTAYIKRLPGRDQPCRTPLPAFNSLPVTPGFTHGRPRPVQTPGLRTSENFPSTRLTCWTSL